MSERTDNELMEAYARGCRASFDELFERYERRAYGFFLRRVRSEERALDLYQELFLRLHRFRDTYEPRLPFAPWFFQIARNVLIDETRQAFRRREAPLEQAPELSREADSERQTAAREELAECLQAFPADQVRVLVEAKLLGREYSEVAADLGKSVDAVKQMASRSMRRLRLARSVAD